MKLVKCNILVFQMRCCSTSLSSERLSPASIASNFLAKDRLDKIAAKLHYQLLKHTDNSLHDSQFYCIFCMFFCNTHWLWVKNCSIIFTSKLCVFSFLLSPSRNINFNLFTDDFYSMQNKQM